jgi:hypothetical protein
MLWAPGSQGPAVLMDPLGIACAAGGVRGHAEPVSGAAVHGAGGRRRQQDSAGQAVSIHDTGMLRMDLSWRPTSSSVL